MDNEALDAPVYIAMSNNSNLCSQPYADGSNQDFTSLPCEVFLQASRISNGASGEKDTFNHKNPMYQSAHVQLKSTYDDDEHCANEKGNQLAHIFVVY